MLLRNERSRPDLVGQRSDGNWIALESKGRVGVPDAQTKQKAKDQADRVVSVLGKPVTGHYAGISYFKVDTLSFYVEDPEPRPADDSNAIAIKGVPAELYRSYYQPLQAAFFSDDPRPKLDGELVWRRVDEIDVAIGIHARLLDLVRQEQWALIGGFCQENGRLFAQLGLHADGVVAKVGESWRTPIRQRDVDVVDDE